MPIHLAEENKEYIIQKISGTDKVKAHLNNLGFIIGEPIRLISKVNDSVILKIKGVSLAISEELARRIMV